MKIEFDDKKTIVYIYRYKLDIKDIPKLNKEIKNIFIKLIKVYHLDFFGYSKVHVYENKKYGCILEIEKIYNNDFNYDIIDLKLIIHENCPFYLEFFDYPFNNEIDICMQNNRYYVSIEKLDNIIKYIEYGKIIYKKMFPLSKSMVQ